MGSKIVLSLAALIFITIGVIPLVIKKNVGDLRPAVFPPKAIDETLISTQSAGQLPTFPLKVPAGYKIGVFSKGLGDPRDLEFSPGGILLVSIPSDGKVIALPDKNSDGIADEVKEILVNLNKPHGLAFYKNKLYVAEETRLAVYDWNEANLQPSNSAELLKLPAGGRHTTRSLAINKDGGIFISIGSSCDVCIEKNTWFGSVIEFWPDRQFPNELPIEYGRGLRNAVFITINPKTNEVWGTEMGRDFLGDNLPPDEINIIRERSHFGWPFCYGNKVKDIKFSEGVNTIDCETSEPPIFEIPAHSAPLGLTFVNSKQFPLDWQGDLFVSYHGSWNSSVPVGYKVVRMDVDGNIIKSAEDFITGFLPAGRQGLDGSEALARPVDLIFDKAGSLYVSDDKAGYVFKVVKQ